MLKVASAIPARSLFEGLRELKFEIFKKKINYSIPLTENTRGYWQTDEHPGLVMVSRFYFACHMYQFIFFTESGNDYFEDGCCFPSGTTVCMGFAHYLFTERFINTVMFNNHSHFTKIFSNMKCGLLLYFDVMLKCFKYWTRILVFVLKMFVFQGIFLVLHA